MGRMDIRSLLEPENAALPVVAGALTYALRQSAKGWFRTRWGQRVLPLLPFALALSLALAGIGTAGTWRERVLFGLLAGATANAGYKLLRTTIAGRGLDDDAHAAALPASSSPPAKPETPSDPPPASAA